MIGILLIYFIGRAFYNLADKFNENKWLWAILGVVSYYAGSFVGGILFGLLEEFEIMPSGGPDDLHVASIALAVVFAAGVVVAFYFILKRMWTRRGVVITSEVLDGDIEY
ncbi:hypothetical protein [Sanyastnella coralliicola]|uniref:hypothetical protein n=1 Tax=Sanyastnella coralliicola TaxID=3069118 RepID=UPI0027BA169A|nr:hypothetical protein [Longitalea sp. SCSIO 12813]